MWHSRLRHRHVVLRAYLPFFGSPREATTVHRDMTHGRIIGAARRRGGPSSPAEPGMARELPAAQETAVSNPSRAEWSGSAAPSYYAKPRSMFQGDPGGANPGSGVCRQPLWCYSHMGCVAMVLASWRYCCRCCGDETVALHYAARRAPRPARSALSSCDLGPPHPRPRAAPAAARQGGSRPVSADWRSAVPRRGRPCGCRVTRRLATGAGTEIVRRALRCAGPSLHRRPRSIVGSSVRASPRLLPVDVHPAVA